MVKVKDAGSRKELRKAHKQAAKEKKQQRHARRAAHKAPAEPTGKSVLPLAAAAGKSGRGGKQTQGGGGGGGGSGGSGNGARRKRWRPEELDPMIAAEDAELKRLERLLGVSGPNAKKKRAKLEREMEVDDGMGDDFGAFLSGLDHISEVVGGGASDSGEDDQGMGEDWEFHKDVAEADSSGSDGAGSENESSSKLGGRGAGLLEGAVDGNGDSGSEQGMWDEEGEDEEEGEGEEEEGTARQGVKSRQHEFDAIEEEEEEEQDGDEGDETNSAPFDTTGYGDEDDGGSSDREIPGNHGVAEDGDAGSGPEEESEEFKRHTYRPKPGQDIYGRAVGAGPDGAAPAMYVPPHLRAAAAAAAAASTAAVGASSTEADKFAGSSKRTEVQRVINGIMNRLSEETLEPVTARLRDAYRGHSTTETNEALWMATRAVCVHDKHVMTTLIPSFAAVIAALNISLGADVGGFFLETIAKELDAEVWGKARGTSGGGGRGGAAGGGGIGGSGGRGGRGTGSNLLLLLAYLYNYGVAHCTLVYDIIGLLVDAFGADEMELLLLLLRYSGYQLRSDDPQALKQIVALVREKSASATADAVTESPLDSAGDTLAGETGRWKAAFGSGLRSEPGGASRGETPKDGDTTAGAAAATAPGGSRARYILDTILELHGNKRNRIQEQGQESNRRVRKWLGSVKTAKGGGGGTGGDASLRVSWSELVSTESRGRWWRVGAAWAGRGKTPPGGTPGGGGATRASVIGAGDGGGKNGAGDAAGVGIGGNNDGDVELLALAARQRMNTDSRRSVFVAIVGSSDCDDALEKILKLNLKGAQEREIARVIVECCSQEGSFNPFYAHLAERVCDRQPKLRFTFQVAFWDALKTLEEGASRRAGSLARLMAHLVIRKQLSLTVLKTVEVQELSPSGLLLMRVFFHEIIAAGDDASFMEVFRRLARPTGMKEGGGHSAARDNTLVFLRGHLGAAPGSWDRPRKKAFRKRVKGACRLIEAIVTSEELG